MGPEEMLTLMAGKGSAKRRSNAAPEGFTKEERAAMRDTIRERRTPGGTRREDGARAVRSRIAEMEPADRALATRIHALVKAVAPRLSPRTWYGMPAYGSDAGIVCFFQPAARFRTRYATLGFTDKATLDSGRVWPTSFAVTKLTRSDIERISDLLRRAAG